MSQSEIRTVKVVRVSAQEALAKLRNIVNELQALRPPQPCGLQGDDGVDFYFGIAEARIAELEALMELATADMIFFHSDEYGPFIGPETPALPQKVAFSVLVNDMFVPAADAEGFDISEAIPLRDVFRKDGWEGVVRWVQAKRDNMPLRPNVEKRVRAKEDLRARIAELERQLAEMREPATNEEASRLRVDYLDPECGKIEDRLRDAFNNLTSARIQRIAGGNGGTNDGK